MKDVSEGIPDGFFVTVILQRIFHSPSSILESSDHGATVNEDFDRPRYSSRIRGPAFLKVTRRKVEKLR
ncbi:MAG: alkene reductase [Chloroflexi bacterium]|nr:alkene reductase [Chloroflexota bacterium]